MEYNCFYSLPSSGDGEENGSSPAPVALLRVAGQVLARGGLLAKGVVSSFSEGASSGGLKKPVVEPVLVGEPTMGGS